MPEAAVFSAWASSLMGQNSGGTLEEAVHVTGVLMDNISLTPSACLRLLNTLHPSGEASSHHDRRSPLIGLLRLEMPHLT